MLPTWCFQNYYSPCSINAVFPTGSYTCSWKCAWGGCEWQRREIRAGSIQRTTKDRK